MLFFKELVVCILFLCKESSPVHQPFLLPCQHVLSGANLQPPYSLLENVSNYPDVTFFFLRPLLTTYYVMSTVI